LALLANDIEQPPVTQATMAHGEKATTPASLDWSIPRSRSHDKSIGIEVLTS
jgi:hypothetical protein